jgi:glycosyltransferase involved in cell wall biosynthesis
MALPTVDDRDAEAAVVTVIASCFNHERFVVECLESIRAQTYPRIQLVVCDDGSADRSVEIAGHWLEQTGTEATFIVHEESHGICRTRNEMLRHARGAYVSSISADDVWLPDKLARQVELMERLPLSVGVVYGDAERMDEAGRPLPRMFIECFRDFERMPQGNVYEALLDGNFIPSMTTLVRRECFEEVGPYDESLAYEDWDMWLRVAQRFEFAFSPYVSARYRIVRGSLSEALGERLWESALRIQAKHLGYGPEWDAALTRRMARIAYKLDHPGQREYLREARRAGGRRGTGALSTLQAFGIPYRRLVPLRKLLGRFGLPGGLRDPAIRRL